MVETSGHWVEDAACRSKPANLFFPDHRTLTAHRFDEARAICASCTVRQKCLEMTIVFEDTDDRWGMFGGLTPNERAILRKELKTMLILKTL